MDNQGFPAPGESTAMIHGSSKIAPWIGFARFCRFAPSKALSRVRARSRIARTRADFDRFSDISKNLQTEMWMKQSDANCSPRQIP